MIRGRTALSLGKLLARPYDGHLQASRTFATAMLGHRNIFSFLSGPPSAWSQAFSEAEKLVGYPTSFMSLRHLLSDELSNVAMHMKQLVSSKHPLMKTVRDFLSDGSHMLQTRGLVVLLISKTAGPVTAHDGSITDQTESLVSGILPSQRTLAEVTEMIHLAYLVHRGVVDLRDSMTSDMELGNKMATLGGDFLLATASTSLAKLYNTQVVELIASAIGDMMEAEFCKWGGAGVGGQVSAERLSLESWGHSTFLSSGSLMAKSCRAATLLAGHPPPVQETAFQFGKHLAAAQQLNSEISSLREKGDEASKNLVSSNGTLSVPLILHINKRPGGSDSPIFINQQLLHEVRQGNSLYESEILCQNYADMALKQLQMFDNSESKEALQKIVLALKL